MLKLKLQFFSEEDATQPEVETFTKEEVTKLLQEQENGFKSQLARMKQKQSKTEKEPEKVPEPETNSNDNSSFDINELRTQILQEVKQEAKQEIENFKQEQEQQKQINELKNMGIKEDEIEKYSTIRKTMSDEEFNDYLRFKNKPLNNSVATNPVNKNNDDKKGQAVSSDFLSSILSSVS